MLYGFNIWDQLVKMDKLASKTSEMDAKGKKAIENAENQLDNV